ncbi:ABC transporter permease [Amorphus sp. MBR-141]
MAQAVGVTRRPAADRIDRVTLVRVATIVVLLVLWEALARSGLLYKDVVPTVGAIAGGIWGIVSDPRFYANLQVTLFEIVASVLLGTVLGVVCGIAIGGSEFVGRVFEPLVHYLAPTPKIIFFPLLIMWFGIGEGSKIGMGTISSFFPIVLSVASGMRHIDPVLVRVGRSFRANPLQMATKIYLPAMRDPMINGIRLAFGVSVIGVLLAETKFARDGLGFMITRFYQQFDMPAMYGLVIIIFAFAIAVNSLLGRLSRSPAP